MVSESCAFVLLLINSGYNFECVVVGRHGVFVFCIFAVERGEVSREICALHRVAEGQLEDLVVHVRVLRLHLRRVRRNVEIARHLVDVEKPAEHTA